MRVRATDGSRFRLVPNADAQRLALMRGLAGICSALIALVLGVGPLGTATQAATPPEVWSLGSGPIDPDRYFGETVANGAIGIVSSATPLRTQKVVIAGAYESGPRDEVSNILSTFNPVGFVLYIDGERVGAPGTITNLRQKLEMKDAVFSTSFDFRDKASVTWEIRALRQLPYSALTQLKIVAKRGIEIKVSGNLEPPTSLIDVHTRSEEILARNAPGGSIPLLTATALGSARKLKVAAAQGFIFDEAADGNQRQVTREADGLAVAYEMHAGMHYEFSIVGSTMTSAQISDPSNATQRMTAFAMLQGSKQLVETHSSRWADLWKSDIVIEGDPDMQRDVHSLLYHLYSFARADSAYSIPPMGLSGDGYHGHIFWDAELWIFPALLALRPDFARSLLDYRYARLPAARSNAAVHGYQGAMFPWESAATGDEETPVIALSGPLEHHITADVGIAAWNYYRVTQDESWLREKGYPLIAATADFWVSRVAHNSPGRDDIRNVVGADEYAQNVDNNAFTNAAARANLAAATAAAKILAIEPNPQWQTVRANIPILRFPNGITREHATYEGELIKQADVNLLAYPLAEVSDPAAIRGDLEYYGKRVDSEGPAMTKSILSTLYVRLGMSEKAYSVFRSGIEPNQRPPFGVIAETAGRANPYFVTGAGGLLQALLYGFGGLRITDHGLVQDETRLPARWRSLAITGIGPQRQTFVVSR